MATAEVFTSGDLKFEVITEPQDGNNGTVNVSGNNKAATEVVIPKTATNNGSTYDVVAIKGTTSEEQNGGFCGYGNLTSITIPDSITYIGEWAFYSCSSLINIELPNSITSISSSIFKDCSKLRKYNHIV